MKNFIKWGLCLCFVFMAGIALAGCGGNELVSLSVSVRNGEKYTYNQSSNTITFQNDVDVPSFVNDQMFVLTANYSQSGSVALSSFSCEVMQGGSNADYVIRLSYQNKSVSIVAKVEREELAFFTNLTQKNYSQNTFVYNGDDIYYTGDEVDIANLILLGQDYSLNNALANGYKAQIGNGVHKSVDANIQNYSYSFALIANNFCYWNVSGRKLATIYIEWQMKPREITISLPTVNSYSVQFLPNPDGTGQGQGPSISLGLNNETYFDLSEDTLSIERESDVGTYLWRINLKEEYRTNNYKFIYSGQKESNLSLMEMGVPYDVSQSSILTIGVKWEITRYRLPISSIDFANNNSSLYSKYYENIDGVAHYRYDENGVYPLTNITTNYLTNYFSVDNIRRVYSMGSFSAIIKVRVNLDLSNYMFSSGENVESSYTLHFVVDGKEYVLPEGFDKTNVELVSITSAETITISEYLYQINSSEGVSPLQYEEVTLYVFVKYFPLEMLEGDYYFELENPEQELVFGDNNVNIIYYYDSFHEGITFNCTLTVSSQE